MNIMSNEFKIETPYLPGEKGCRITWLYTDDEEKTLYLSVEQAEGFYSIHKDKPFFEELVEFMTSSETHIMKLEKANAVLEWRNLMGATNPAEAEAGTIRAKYGTDISMNAPTGVKVVIVILTDGMNNSYPDRWAQSSVKQLITNKREKDNWEFIFCTSRKKTIKMRMELNVFLNI